MRMLQSILLATDFRPASQAAAEAATLLSSAFHSRVTVFHVLEKTWPISSQENQEALLKHLAGEGVDVANVLIGTGPPADAIVRKANEMDADLVLLGAGELSRFQRFSVGPVATAVLERAPQPVLAVRPGEPTLRFKKILCPVDHSAPAGRGLRNAICLARACGGELVILTVVPTVRWLTAAVETGHFAGARAEHESKWRLDFERFLATIPTHEVKAHTEVRHGKPHEQIVAAAQEHQADVIVMGATGHTGLVRVLLGSTTRRLLEQLPCSLLVVKDEDVVQELFEDEVRLVRLLMAEGRELLNAGVHETALTRFRQVLAHNPFHISATRGLAEAYEKLGKHDQARYYRRRAEDLEHK